MPGSSRSDRDRGIRRRSRNEPERDERRPEHTYADEDTYADEPDLADEDTYADEPDLADEEPYADERDVPVEPAGRNERAAADRRGERARARRRSAGALPAAQAARAGLEYVAELTGKPTTGVTSLDRSEHGWAIGVEVVEDRRIPSSADILAVYQTEVGMAGELIGYRRTRRYPRGRGDGGVG